MFSNSQFKIIGGIFCALAISYFYVLSGDFFGDDIDRIVFNPEIFSYWTALTGRLGDRPLLMLVVTFISKTFGNETIYFRLFSIFIQSLVGYQIYLFILELNTGSQNKIKNEIALLCAFGFALHPLNSQAITTAIQVSVLFTGLFGLLSLRYFFKGIAAFNDVNFKKSYLFYFSGMLFKPSLFFLPLFYFFNKDKITKPKRNQLLISSSYFLVLAVPFIFYFYGQKNAQVHNLSPLTYFLVQSEVLFTYFKLIFVPYDFKFLYDFTIPKDVWNSWNWIYVLLHCGIIVLAYLKLPNRLLWTLFLGFYLSFIPESSFFSINHLAFEHRTYFPLIFFFLFAGSCLIHLNISDHYDRTIKIITAAVTLLFIILNQNRNVEIKRYGTWAHHTLSNSTSYEYHNYLFSFYLVRAGNFELAEPIIKSYLNLFPNRDYEVLVDILEYYKNPKQKYDYYQKFIRRLENSELRRVPRQFLNKILIDDYAHKNENLNELMQIEHILGHQLPLLNDSNDTMIKAIKENYLRLALFLTTGLLKDEYQKKHPISFLKSKVYLHVYFNHKNGSLKSEIEKELKNYPEEKQLKDLLEMITKADKPQN